MAKQRLSGVIDLTTIEHIDPKLTLKVAVARHCRVIASTLVVVEGDQRVAKFSLDFETPGKDPAGVIAVVAPDVPDERLRSVDRQELRVSAREFGDNGANLELKIEPRLYTIWRSMCRTYRIRGRVVCRQLRYDPIEQQYVPCEAPVRGARVTASDVDRFWWWTRVDPVGSDFTDVNGHFEITFRQCCWWWGPWFRHGWRLDPTIVKRIRDLSEVASPVIPLPPPTPELDLDLFARIASEIDAAAPPAPGTPVPGPERFAELGPRVAALLPAAPDLAALRVWPWWPHRDCAPDIIFEVRQDCGEGENVVYAETAADTRWNIPTDLSGVVLVANDLACCPPCCVQPPDTDCLVFQGVGCGGYPVTVIDQNLLRSDGTANPLVGYARPGTDDRPFGGTIRVLGVFGDGAPVDFYKVQSRHRDSASGLWSAWADIPESQLASFVRSHWIGFPPPFWKPQTVAPELVDGEIVIKTTRRFRAENADIVDTVDPTRDHWLFLWRTSQTTTAPGGERIETPLIADGLHELRIVGYRYDAAADRLIDPRVMPLCPAEDSPLDPADHAGMRLRIDNRNAIHEPGTVHVDTMEPVSDFPNICAVVKNEGKDDEECVNVCGVVSVVAGDTLTVHFEARDVDAHLERYALSAHWSESAVFNVLAVGTPEPDPDKLVGPSYAHTFLGAQATERGTLAMSDPERDRPGWKGGKFKVTVTVGAAVPGTRHHAFETCCAYLLRLKVWKRTTDGCTSSQHFDVNWSEFSFTVVRADLPCAASVLTTESLATP